MSELETKSDAIWKAIVSKIEDEMRNGRLGKISRLYTQRRQRESQLPSPAIVVLDRIVSISDWSGHRGLANLTATFGLVATSYHPAQSGAVLGELVFSLVDVFLDDHSLGGLVHDTVPGEINVDAVPAGTEESTQPWSTASLTWQFTFLR